MKDFFNKLGFHMMDEMERNISLKAQRNALIYVEFTLMIWALYESYKAYEYHTNINLLPCFLLISTSMVMIFSQLYLQRKAVKDDEDFIKEHQIFKMIIVFALVFTVIASIGAFLIMTGR